MRFVSAAEAIAAAALEAVVSAAADDDDEDEEEEEMVAAAAVSDGAGTGAFVLGGSILVAVAGCSLVTAGSLPYSLHLKLN